MANSDNNISDTNLSINPTGIVGVCSDWRSAVSSANLESIDVTSVFSALISNGVGTNYFDSLKNALQKTTNLSTNIANLIGTTAEEQQNNDERGSNNAQQIGYGTGTNNGGGTSSGGNSLGGNSSGSVNTGSYDVEREGTDLNVNSENEAKAVEFTDDEQLEMVVELQSMVDEELYDYLFEIKDSTVIRQKLLSSPNISDDIKAKIVKMDENEIKVLLKDFYISGKCISDFSKIIVTVYDRDLTNNFKKATIFDSAKSISDVYSFLSKQSNCQEELKSIYSENSIIDKVDDNVINFTKSFVDTMAVVGKTTPEELLSSPDFESMLVGELEDLSKTFSIIDLASKNGDSSKEALYSNIIVEEG